MEKNSKKTRKRITMDENEKRIFRTFLRFLKENKLMKTYEDNLYDYIERNRYEEYKMYNFNIIEYIFRYNHKFNNNSYRIEDLMIRYSMIWTDTIKGFKFWEEVDRRWKYYFMERKSTDHYLFT